MGFQGYALHCCSSPRGQAAKALLQTAAVKAGSDWSGGQVTKCFTDGNQHIPFPWQISWQMLRWAGSSRRAATVSHGVSQCPSVSQCPTVCHGVPQVALCTLQSQHPASSASRAFLRSQLPCNSITDGILCLSSAPSADTSSSQTLLGFPQGVILA